MQLERDVGHLRAGARAAREEDLRSDRAKASALEPFDSAVLSPDPVPPFEGKKIN